MPRLIIIGFCLEAALLPWFPRTRPQLLRRCADYRTRPTAKIHSADLHTRQSTPEYPPVPLHSHSRERLRLLASVSHVRRPALAKCFRHPPPVLVRRGSQRRVRERWEPAPAAEMAAERPCRQFS